jgi:hypothetical protein
MSLDFAVDKLIHLNRYSFAKTLSTSYESSKRFIGRPHAENVSWFISNHTFDQIRNVWISKISSAK